MLSYAEYSNLGGTLEEAAYERVSFGVFADIDRCTFGRVSKLAPLPEAVKRLIVELCAIAAPYNTDTDDDLNRYKIRLIYSYLSGVCTADGTPLLYRGVDA